MPQQRGDVLDALQRDAFALLDGERMIGRLDLNERAHAIVRKRS